MTPAAPPVSLVYRIDSHNRITWVNDAWATFAHGNEGGSVLPVRVLGKNLFDCMTDDRLQALYAVILKRVRTGVTVEFNFRCDAPDRRREFAMTVRPQPDFGVEFTSTMTREEVRTSVPLLESGRPRTRALLPVCSWCQKVATPDGKWLPVEEAVNVLRLVEAEELPDITHGICEACLGEMLAKLQKM